MEIKRGIILGLMVIGVLITDVSFMYLFHIPVTLPLACTVAYTLFMGIIAGTLEHKWKRDKQMAGFVAERLMGKPKVEPSSDTQWVAGMGQQVGSMGHQNANILGSLLGSNPIIGQGETGNFLGRLK